MDEKAKLLATLFRSDGEEHVNIKFFRGEQADVSEEEFCREVNRALSQVNDGTVEALPRFPDRNASVDVADFVRAL
jgi:hypothetical protein